MPLAIMWSAVFFIDCQRETLFVSRLGGVLPQFGTRTDCRTFGRQPSTTSDSQTERATSTARRRFGGAGLTAD